MDKKKSITQAR
jgi:hypothetical protein